MKKKKPENEVDVTLVKTPHSFTLATELLHLVLRVYPNNTRLVSLAERLREEIEGEAESVLDTGGTSGGVSDREGESD